MSLLDIAETVYSDFQARKLPELTPRRVELVNLPGKADAIVGMRRTGKTWRLFQEIQTRLASGARKGQMLYVNFEDERLPRLEATALHHFTDAAYRRVPEASTHGLDLYLDEVQNVEGWERFVRRFLDEGRGRVVVTGSSSRLLSREIATSLRGRSLATELLPFSFAEYLDHAGIATPEEWPPPEATRHMLAKHLENYLSVGGFPEIQGLEESLRVRILQDYVDVVLFRDVVERHGVSNVEALRYLVRRLLDAPAGRFSIHRFYNDLRSQGRSVSKDTLHAMLAHLEDACLVFTLPIDTRSERVRTSNPRKAYPIDPGLARASSFRAAANTGHLLETCVFLELRRRRLRCAYGVTSSGFEVDFVVRERSSGEVGLVQVSADVTDPDTRRRELRSLDEAMVQWQVDRAEVVTLTTTDTVALEHGEVRFIPAWRWLLDEQS